MGHERPMSKKERMASVFNLIGGKPENIEKIADQIDDFLDTINADLEDWKISMEEYSEGTRIYARFRVLIKK
jgi:hypothetical protein